MLTTAQVTEIADKILRSRLEEFGYDRVEVRTVKDEENQDALYLVGHLHKSSKLVPGKVLNETIAELGSALLRENDERFPYVAIEREGEELPEFGPRENH